jgi:hypothetical protein
MDVRRSGLEATRRPLQHGQGPARSRYAARRPGLSDRWLLPAALRNYPTRSEIASFKIVILLQVNRNAWHYSRYPTPTGSNPRVVWFLELLASAKTVGYVCKLLAVERNVDASTHTSISCTIECSPPLSPELSNGVLVVQGRGDLILDSESQGNSAEDSTENVDPTLHTGIADPTGSHAARWPRVLRRHLHGLGRWTVD